MHETVIADSIIKEANKHGDVKEIYLEIGALAHIPRSDLLGCMKKLVTWKIHAAEKKAHVKCTCGFTGEPKILDRGHDYFLIECPECRKVPEVVEGKDIKIVKIVVN